MFRLIVLFVLAFGLSISSGNTKEDRRVALVIGNSNYVDATSLKNPLNDANDIAAALRRLNFDVVLGIDQTRAQMIRTLRSYSKKLDGADTAVLYYAGHALQVGGTNYLAPIDTKLEREDDLEFEAVSLNLYRRHMEKNAKTLLIFLDACRDNPLSRRFARKSRSSAKSRGLAKPDNSSVGTHITFSTQPGNVALDGKGRNSPFTASLLKHIEKPGIEISSLMINVRRDVYKATNQEQTPWTSSGLLGKFFFSPAKNIEVVSPVSTGPNPLQLFQLENEAWKNIKNSQDTKLLEEFILAFPKGSLAPIAQFKLEQIEILNNVKLAREDRARINAVRNTQIANENKARIEADLVARIARETQIAKKRVQNEAKLRARIAQEEKTRIEAVLTAKFERQEKARIEAARVEKNARERKIRAENIVVASLPKPSPPIITNVVEPVTAETIRSIQNQLNRVGCDAGSADGKWGRKGRKALQNFSKRAGIKLVSLEPSREILEKLEQQNARVCPLVCSARYKVSANQCVLKTCGSGQKLKNNGQCYTPIVKTKPKKKNVRKATVKKKTVKRKTTKKSSGGSCFTFNGKRICN